MGNYNIDVLKDENGNVIRPATVTDNVVNPETRKTVTEEIGELAIKIDGKLLASGENKSTTTSSSTGLIYYDVAVSVDANTPLLLRCNNDVSYVNVYTKAWGENSPRPEVVDGVCHIKYDVASIGNIRLVFSEPHNNVWFKVFDYTDSINKRIEDLNSKVDTLKDDASILKTEINEINGYKKKLVLADCPIKNGFLAKSQNGEFKYDDKWATSDFINVIDNAVLNVCLYQLNNAVCVVFYNESKNIISINNEYESIVKTRISIPDNAKYFRVSFSKNIEVENQYVNYSISGKIDKLEEKISGNVGVKKYVSTKRVDYDFYNHIDKGVINGFANYEIQADGLLVTYTSLSEVIRPKVQYISLELKGTARVKVVSNTTVKLLFTSSDSIGLRYSTNGGWAQITRKGVSVASFENSASSVGDILLLEAYRYYDDIVCVVRNETKGWERALVYKYGCYTYPREGDMPLITANLSLSIESGSVLVKSMSFDNLRWKRTPTTVVIGDSISSMFSAENRENCWQFKAWEDNVDRMCTIGYPGANSAMMVDYMTEALNFNPKYIAIYLGTNDVIQNVPVSIFAENIKKIVEQALVVGVTPILIGLAPVYGTIRNTYIDAVKEIADEHKLKYVDTSSVVTTSDIVGDNVHLSPTGHGKLGQLFAEICPEAVE